jgi:chromosome partitioning protein
VKTAIEGVGLLPADATLAEANVALVGELGRERRLRAAIEGLDDAYDAVLVDTPPTRSLLTVNALNAVRDAIIPVAPGLFSLSGLAQLWGVVEEVRRYLDNRALRVAGLVLTMVERNNVSRDLEEQLRAAYGPLVYRTAIPRSVKVEESISRFEPVIDYAPRSPAARAYIELTGEIIDDGQRQQGTADGARDGRGGPAEADGRAA